MDAGHVVALGMGGLNFRDDLVEVQGCSINNARTLGCCPHDFFRH
jgi:hypothetical protein